MSPTAFALAAHPDDIEFLMAGTLILLRRTGYDIHYMNIASGSCGSAEHSAAETAALRLEEAREAAARIGAVFHPPLADDLAVFYEPRTLARIGAVMRDVAPEILLLHSPDDYMEDHQNAARLGVTAAFGRCMPNFPVDPPRAAVEGPVAVYHAQPYGNRAPLGDPVRPGIFVDISSVIEDKRAMLACHRSQKEWLDRSQGVDSYLLAMEAMGREVGAMSGRFPLAEGWRQRLHFGFGPEHFDPLAQTLGLHASTGRSME